MKENLILYRADNKGNITMPEKFSTDGLLTKQINGGDPFFYNKYGWLKSIKSHIHIDNPTEKHIHETTAFLSFTSNREIAEKIYLPTINKYECEKTTFESADAFLFSFELEKQSLKPLGKGLYLYTFQCNYERYKNPQSMIDSFIKCNICVDNIEYKHTLLLIDAVTYLSKLSISNLELTATLENSNRDSEWLVMPLDLMKDSIGYQSRIPVANFWSIEYYKQSKK